MSDFATCYVCGTGPFNLATRALEKHLRAHSTEECQAAHDRVVAERRADSAKRPDTRPEDPLAPVEVAPEEP